MRIKQRLHDGSDEVLRVHVDTDEQKIIAFACDYYLSDEARLKEETLESLDKFTPILGLVSDGNSEQASMHSSLIDKPGLEKLAGMLGLYSVHMQSEGAPKFIDGILMHDLDDLRAKSLQDQINITLSFFEPYPAAFPTEVSQTK